MNTRPSHLLETESLTAPYLFASFYIGGQEAIPIAKVIAETLALTKAIGKPPFGAVAQWQRSDSQGFINLCLYSTTNKHKSLKELSQDNAAMLQVLLAKTGKDNVEGTWTAFRQQLLTIMYEAKLFPSFTTSEQTKMEQSDLLWGYSLVYGADYTGQPTLDNYTSYQLDKDLQDTVKSFTDEPTYTIEQITFEVNKLSLDKEAAVLTLADVPTNLGKEAGLVYWLIMPSNDSIFADWCISPYSKLSQIDLLAHKTFMQSTQLRSLRGRWDATIDRLLWDNASLYQASGKDGNLFSLESISRNTRHLLSIHPLTEAVNASLQQQIANLGTTDPHLRDNAIVRHLAKLMKNDAEDAFIFTNKLREISSAIRTSINFHRLKLAEKEEASEKKGQIRIANFGLLLGVLQVFDNAGADKLIQWFTGEKTPAYLEEVFVRVAVAVSVALGIPALIQSLSDAITGKK